MANELLQNQNPSTIQHLLQPAVGYDENYYTIKATITDIDATYGWWYLSCPQCMHFATILQNNYSCDMHGTLLQQPKPRYRVTCTIQDGTAQATLLLTGNIAEMLFGCSCDHLITQCGYIDKYFIPQQLVNVLNKPKIFRVSRNKYYSLPSDHHFNVSHIFPIDDGEGNHVEPPAANE